MDVAQCWSACPACAVPVLNPSTHTDICMGLEVKEKSVRSHNTL